MSAKACCGLFSDWCLRRHSVPTQTHHYFVRRSEQHFRCENHEEHTLVKHRRKERDGKERAADLSESEPPHPPRKFLLPSVQAHSTNPPSVMFYLKTNSGLRQAVAGVNCSCLNTRTCLGRNEQQSNKRTTTQSKTNYPSERSKQQLSNDQS